MELRHLRYLIAVAEEGHVTRAAKRLGMQQPPLSQQLRALEQEVGTPLFHRLPRGMVLTAAGEVFLAEARAVLARAEQSVARARHAAAGQVGRVMIGVTGSALLHPLTARAIGRFHRLHPAMGLDVREANEGELTGALLRGELDVAVLRAPVSQPFGLVFEELLREAVVVVLPEHHPLGGRGIGLEQVRDERFVLVRSPVAPWMYGQLIERCRAAGFEPTVAVEVDRMLVAARLVAAGIGITVVPASFCMLQQSGVSFASLTGAEALVAPLFAASRHGDERPVVTELLQAIRNETAGSGGEA